MLTLVDRTLTAKEVELIREEITSGEPYRKVARKWKLDIGHVKFIGKRFEEPKKEAK